MYFDAHNHLQDDRLLERVEQIVAQAQSAGVNGMVVNGTTERDWLIVRDLAERYAGFVRPAFGLHPWFVGERSPHWEESLSEFLAVPGSSVGEIGLDRWIENADIDDQRDVFLRQLQMAAERNMVASIHCLQAWGELVDCLDTADLPERGFLLHSYGGSMEIADRLLPLGAHFSFPGAFAREKKQRQRDVFASIPLDRLLIETDAPDQLPPRWLQRVALATAEGGAPLNHPANLPGIYRYIAELRNQSLDSLVEAINATVERLFPLSPR